MEIIKLGNICNIKNGKDLHTNISLNKILTNLKTNLIYAKTSCFENGYQLKPKWFVKEEYINDNNVPKLILKKGDLIISKACNVGEPSFIKYDNTALYRAMSQLIPNEKIILKKYLFFLLKKEQKNFLNIAHGTTIKIISIDQLKDFKVNVPSLKTQQSIIDIIEPFEKIQNLVNSKTHQLIEIIKNQKPISKSKLIDNVSLINKEKPHNINQVSAKVLSEKNPLIQNIEEKNTYESNMYFVKKGSLIINTIRTYLKKFCILPNDYDVTGTMAHFDINKNATSVLHSLLNDDFWNETIQKSKGTKMPVIDKKDLVNINIDLIKLEIPYIIDYFTCLNNINLILNKIIKNLIDLYIK